MKRIASDHEINRGMEHHYLQMILVGTIALILAAFSGNARGFQREALDKQASSPTEALRSLDGYRFGISVTDLDGDVLIAYRASERFVPASNLKLFVTAAALSAEDELSALQSGLRVELRQTNSGVPNLRMVGRGDPTVGFGKDCGTRCIEELADAVAASGITSVGDIIGDDRWFADERKPLGWNWDDLKFGHGTAVSALAVNKNILPLRVSPSDEPGKAVKASWLDGQPSYFKLENEAKTSDANSPRALRLERRIGDRTARLYGELPQGSKPVTLDLAVDNPAHLAIWYFRKALEGAGVSVSGTLQTTRRPLQYADELIVAGANASSIPSTTVPPVSNRLSCVPNVQPQSSDSVVATLPPARTTEIVNKINKESINLYAEVLLRQLGYLEGRGSSFCGLAYIEQFLTAIGVPRTSYDIADGSGLSNYNRVTPAAVTALLRYAAKAPWADAYRASLPVAGARDGTLKYRFRGTPLEGKVFAKTGTLNHVDALSGYMQAASGRTLVFSIIVNDRPLESPSAMRQIESTLLKIAERY